MPACSSGLGESDSSHSDPLHPPPSYPALQHSSSMGLCTKLPVVPFAPSPSFTHQSKESFLFGNQEFGRTDCFWASQIGLLVLPALCLLFSLLPQPAGPSPLPCSSPLPLQTPLLRFCRCHPHGFFLCFFQPTWSALCAFPDFPLL